MQRYNARLHDIPIPDCAHLPFLSDEYWACQVSYFYFSFFYIFLRYFYYFNNVNFDLNYKQKLLFQEISIQFKEIIWNLKELETS